MMEFQKLIEVRRSVRKYAADKKVTKEELMEMIGAAQEAPSWKNTETGRYYCVLSEEMTERVRRECLPEGNARKAENAVLVVTTFIKLVSRMTKLRIMNWAMVGDVMTWDCRMKILF